MRGPVAPASRLGGTTMGTRWSLTYVAVPGVTAGQLQAAVTAVFDRVVAQMSHWETGSDISRFHRAEAGGTQVIPADFAAVLTCALHWAKAGGGAFDPTIGPLVDAWGFGPRAGERDYTGTRPPSSEERQKAAAAVGWQHIDFSPDTRTLRQPGGQRLDLSGIAKGHAVDLACEAVAACGVTDFLMEVGGELRARGRRPGGGAWTVGIEQADAAGLLPLPLDGRAIATSGDRWHAYEHDGVRYAHTLDPRTGAPVAHDLASVTVVHPHCMDADALATLLLVLGPQQGPAFAERHGIAAWFVRRGPSGAVAHPSRAFEQLA